MPQVDFDLYLITDRHQTGGRDLLDILRHALDAGVRAIQLREKDLSTRELYELARTVRKLTESYGARLLINDRVDITLAVDADGVHLGNSSLPIYKARQLLGPDRLIGVSCHNQTNVVTAQGNGADFVTFGPVYQTPSKVIYGHPVGLDPLQTASEIAQIPVFGLGGIKRDRIEEVLSHGATGIALVSAIIAAPDPGGETEAILSLIRKVKSSER
ncbi:MAG: thiamine phosphate synthase [Desulfuromonadia bacterium]